mmetsp:Transcript_16499/g.35728  ORF Transcript_16499/g.35728 Transcript_16499/m.35728 type:complete len:398 (+) Transcript_16499:176-1369(+)
MAPTEPLRQRRSANNSKNGADPLKSSPPTSDESSCSDSEHVATTSHFANTSDDAPSSSTRPTPPAFSSSPSAKTSSSMPYLQYVGLLVWPCMLFLPLLLTTTSHHYSTIFPRQWYTLNGEKWLNAELEQGGIWNSNTWINSITAKWYDKPLRHPLGLTLGISAVAIGHVFLLIYFRMHQQQLLGKTTPIQSRGAVQYVYYDALKHHLAQPGGFLLLGLYLTITWVFDMLPSSYYSFEGGIQYGNVALCLICQDFVQFIMHKVEHVAHPKVYRISHKPHHKYTNPKLFDAFDGSVPDTAIMILAPLFVTAHVVRTCNVWTYMAFGSTYANWLTLIHSEVTFPWEGVFRKLGLGTAADHHVHHKFFKYNFGHLFMWFDMLVGSYRSPKEVWGKEFNVGV